MHLNSSQTVAWHDSGGEMHGAGLTRTRWHSGGGCLGVVTCSKNRLQLVVEESAISAGQIAVILTSHAYTAHHNKNFAGNSHQHCVDAQAQIEGFLC